MAGSPRGASDPGQPLQIGLEHVAPQAEARDPALPLDPDQAGGLELLDVMGQGGGTYPAGLLERAAGGCAVAGAELAQDLVARGSASARAIRSACSGVSRVPRVGWLWWGMRDRKSRRAAWQPASRRRRRQRAARWGGRHTIGAPGFEPGTSCSRSTGQGLSPQQDAGVSLGNAGGCPISGAPEIGHCRGQTVAQTVSPRSGALSDKPKEQDNVPLSPPLSATSATDLI